MKRTFITLLLGLVAYTAYPQQSKVDKEVNHEGKISFLRFNEEKLKKPLSEAGKLLADSLSISNGNSLLLRKTQKDDLGFTHQYYGQYYRGIKVEHGIYAVHAKNNRIEYISGTYKKVDNVSTTPKLSPQEALNKALKIINAKTYKWENPLEERLLKEITGKIDTTYYPKGELVIIENILQSSSQYRLAYKFNIYAEMPLSRKIYYIDAINGSLLYTEQLIKHANAPGTAQTRYSGARTVTTDSFAGGFRLQEVRNGVNIRTYNMNRTATYGTTDFIDNDNNWTAGEHNNTNMDNAALDAHWGAERVYDYFLNTHNRNSWNGSGGILLNYVHANLVNMGYSSNDNAFWDGQRMTYGDGSTQFTPLTSLDVVAHEIGHGIMSSTANLAYSGESGALNEGFSDIWAACVEAQAAPTKQRWQIGEDITRSGQSASYLRSMQNPNSGLIPQPDTYGGKYWANPSNLQIDNGGVHINSGVLNFWFYLLVQGGSGTNDIGSNYSVAGVGINNAASIAYRAMTINLPLFPQATFNNARTQTIQAAVDLFGSGSCQHAAVVDAWHAVGVGTKFPEPSIAGTDFTCTNASFQLYGAPSGASVTWTASSAVYPQSGSGTTANVAAVTGANTLAWIEFTIPGFCKKVKKFFWAGVPNMFGISGYSEEMAGTPIQFRATTYPESYVQEYRWYLNNVLQDETSELITLRDLGVGEHRIELEVANECGWSSYRESLDFVIFRGYYGYTIYPNPAEEEMTVTVKPSDVETATINVYNNKGIKVRSIQAQKGHDKVVLDVRGFAKGNYVLHIIQNGKVVTRQVILGK